MNKRVIGTLFLIIMSVNIYAETLKESLENINVELEVSTTQENMQQPIEVRSVRGILSGYDPLEHTRGQLRAGYINFTEDGSPHTWASSLAGHFHVNTKRWNGLMVGAEAYTVLKLGNNQEHFNLNSDFFDVHGKSFMLLSQAYLDGKWGNTEMKLGRQSLDTPHADSDDLRMIPNYFEVYRITNTDIEDVTLSAGFINRKAGYSHEISKNISLVLGLQYDGSQETGAALLGKQDAQTYGISLETNFTDIGVTLLAAYNQDNGDTGAMGLSLGGGPFFTSMEDQTLDALETSGSAWIIGAGYDLGKIGVDNLTFGVAYGSFKADDSSLYKSREIDAVLEYNFNDKITLSAAYASVDFKVDGMEDYDQFRVIANYNF